MAYRRLGAMALALALMAGLAAPSQAAAQTIDLIVAVDNLRSAQGQVRIALWLGPDGFTEADAAIVTAAKPAEDGRVYFRFEGLPTGHYAIATYHDENDNNRFDRTWLGFPDEGLGFSNGAWIELGPPAFEAAAVEVTPQPKVIFVSLRY